MKKSIVFDSGPVISLATNSLLWMLEPLKKKFRGDFLIPEGVKKEIIDRPLKSKRFKFEAMQVLSAVNKGALMVVRMQRTKKLADELMDLANKSFKAKGRWLKMVHQAEIEALALAIIRKSSALVVDERTTRLLVENPEKQRKIMEKKLHTKVEANRKSLREFRKKTDGIHMLRSAELVTIAYEKGLLEEYLPNIPKPRKELIDSVLWGLKLNGCSISKREIDSIVKIETK